jgi:5,10-methylene-tetrahydrofolate dehydrogenase/methenyl tetrahydrofolate cyclohydrolase
MSDSETYSKKKKRKAEEVGLPPKKHKKHKVRKEQFPNEFHEEQNDELRLPGLNCGRLENGSMSDSETYSKKKKRKAEEVGLPPKKHKKHKVRKEQFPNEFHEEQNDELRLPGLNCGRLENEKKT